MNNPLKIAQFIDTLGVGGAETMLIRLAEAIHSSEHQVVVFHFGNPYISQQTKALGIEEVIIPYLELYKSVLTIFQFSKKLAQLLNEHKIDILHSHLYGSITGAYFGCWKYNIPHLGTLHDKYMVEERLGRGLLLRLTQSLNTQLVTVSKDMQAFYENYIPLSKKINCIYNGFDPESDSSSQQHIIQTTGSTTATKVVSVGRLIPLKRHKEQISAMAALLQNNNIELFIVGGGDEYENLSNHIKALSLEKKVFLLGERTDVATILDDADIFTLTSASEGLSCSIIEALSAGLPCVVSNVGGNKELIEHGENGFVYELNEENQLPERINQLTYDCQLRKQMKANNQQKAKTVFSVEQMLSQYINKYQAMLSH